MRRGHRSTHAGLWLVLALVLPVAVGLAIAFSAGAPVEPGLAALRAAAAQE